MERHDKEYDFEEVLETLLDQVKKLKMRELFEEPSSFEDEFEE